MNEELLKQAIKALNIQDVRLRAIDVRVQDKFDPLFPAQDTLTVQFRHRVVRHSVGDVAQPDGEKQAILRAEFECAFRLLPGDLGGEALKNEEAVEQQLLAEAIAVFSAYYTMSEQIEEDAVGEFCKHNVGYHVWPYWRELASSVALRVGLPQITIPFYKVPST